MGWTDLGKVPFSNYRQCGFKLFVQVHEEHGIERVVHGHVPSVEAAKGVMLRVQPCEERLTYSRLCSTRGAAHRSPPRT